MQIQYCKIPLIAIWVDLIRASWDGIRHAQQLKICLDYNSQMAVILIGCFLIYILNDIDKWIVLLLETQIDYSRQIIYYNLSTKH